MTTPAPTKSTKYTPLDTPSARLADLLARFDELKDSVKEAEEALEERQAVYDEVRQAILAEAHAALPTEEKIKLVHPALDRPLNMRWQVSRRLDAKLLEAERPEIHKAYVRASGHWVLERAR